MTSMSYFLLYRLPPILWMGFLFPENSVLTYESTSRFLVPFLTWLLPFADQTTIKLVHIGIRKSVHFFEYGLLAFLLFRAIRSGRKEWRPEWMLYAGIICLAYTALDELLQVYFPFRTGQFSDWMINAAGVVCTLGLISLKFRISMCSGATPKFE
ncbi:MAG: VanZ family protein [Nitrospirae bacterium]|nr:VanZ family protein [Nitrospirota bacterium]